MPDYESRLRLLEDENSMLRERVAILETEIGIAHEPFPVFLDLTTSECIILGVLMKNTAPRKSTFMTALYGGKMNDKEAELKIIDVFVCKMRSKLKAYGIDIETAWGAGYSLTEANKAKVRELMAASP